MSFKRPGTESRIAFGVSYEEETSTSGRIPLPSRPVATFTRVTLPVHQHKKEILFLVENHATTIIVGETGSGKSTQIPQFLHSAGWADSGYQIVCTQPRRVAAIGVAGRVAEEMGVELGTVVGYAVRFEEATRSEVTKIKFVTDGLLVREMMDDPLLSKYSVVMVDEAHERSVHTDMLLGLLKKVQRQRPELRVVVSSATLEARKLSAFFNTATSLRAPQRPGLGALTPSRQPAIMSVRGRTHPVQVHYLLEPTPDYVRCAVQTAVDIHKEDVPGDILIFLTGQDEVESAVRMLQEEANKLKRSRLANRLQPLPLYAGLPGADQRAVFAAAPRGVRKVVASTNVSETSLTLEGVVYVVDAGFVKERCYDPLTGLDALLVAPISQASASQRAGRAGRIRPGHCFRLYTQQQYEQMRPTGVPEVCRSDLAPLVLGLKGLGVDNVMRFEWLDPPPAEVMVRALEQLHAIGALSLDARLTPDIGARLSSLPLEPLLGRCLLSACARGCGAEMCAAAALLSVNNGVWTGGGRGPREVAAARARFAVAEGDLAALLNAFRAWLARGQSGKWAYRHCLNQHALTRADAIRRQLLATLRRMGVAVSALPEGEDIEPLRKAAAEALALNLAVFERVEFDPTPGGNADGPAGGTGAGVNVYRLVRHRNTVRRVRLRMHTSSVLAHTAPPAVVFLRAQLGVGGWAEMQVVTPVDPDWMTEVAPHMFATRAAGLEQGIR